MRALDAYEELRLIGRPLVTTREAATRLKTSVSNASHMLRSMDESGLVRRIRRGLWAIDRDLDPFPVAPYLTAPYPAYVSFWSALARHEIIEQVPRRVFVASLDRSKQVRTTIGTYSVHHLAPELFGGFVGSQAEGYVAEPEKALFDAVYIRAVRRQRSYFPELSRTDTFDETKLDRWVARVPSARERTLVAKRLRETLLALG